MKFEYTEDFRKQFAKLDKPVQRRIRDYMREIERLENPRTRGKPLKHNLSGLWRYRVGDYRIFCRILDTELVIHALEIGHRREVYKP